MKAGDTDAGVNRDSCDLYFVGLKPFATPIFPFDAAGLKQLCADTLAELKIRLDATFAKERRCRAVV
ncbi:hypothetical protein [Novosphingobium lentum]|uniref:hypothetical protein n=1 Tax=Novosphingobium lentum TaxID=145287 RepID=UPI0008354BEA|nr:hypothetical protein [Novosphingobium lentum]